MMQLLGFMNPFVTAGAVNVSVFWFETFAIVVVFVTAALSLIRVTEIGSVKFAPRTVMVACGLPSGLPKLEPSWLRSRGDALVIEGGSTRYVNVAFTGLHASA